VFLALGERVSFQLYANIETISKHYRAGGPHTVCSVLNSKESKNKRFALDTFVFILQTHGK